MLECALEENVFFVINFPLSFQYWNTRGIEMEKDCFQKCWHLVSKSELNA